MQNNSIISCRLGSFQICELGKIIGTPHVGYDPVHIWTLLSTIELSDDRSLQTALVVYYKMFTVIGQL